MLALSDNKPDPAINQIPRHHIKLIALGFSRAPVKGKLSAEWGLSRWLAVRALATLIRSDGGNRKMHKIFMAGAMLGLVLGVAVPIKATALTLSPATRPLRRTATRWSSRCRGGAAVLPGAARAAAAVLLLAWPASCRCRLAWPAACRCRLARPGWRRGWVGPRWRVGWVGPGYYYNPAFYNRYYNPRWGYCRIIWGNGARVCRWHRRPWW